MFFRRHHQTQQQQQNSSMFEQMWRAKNIMSQFPPKPANHRQSDVASHATMTLLLLVAIAIVSALEILTAAAASKNTTNHSSVDDDNTRQVDNRTAPSSDRMFSTKNESELDA